MSELPATALAEEIDTAGDGQIKAMITIADVMQSNGVIHVIDTVLMPG